MKKRDWYTELKTRLNRIWKSGVLTPANVNELSMICDKISWCWKWKHITDTQKDELCQYATELWSLERA